MKITKDGDSILIKDANGDTLEFRGPDGSGEWEVEINEIVLASIYLDRAAMQALGEYIAAALAKIEGEGK